MINLDKLPNAKPGEKTVLFLRRHWFIPAKIVAVLILLLAIPVIIYFILKSQAPWMLGHDIVAPLLAMVASLYYLAAWVYAFSEYIDYYLDIWIVTNERIINIEQQGLFARTASELNLSAVQDVTSEIRGVIQTFFDYGEVHVQTAAETTRFVFKQINNPDLVKRQIIQLSDQLRSKQRMEPAEEKKTNIKKTEL